VRAPCAAMSSPLNPLAKRVTPPSSANNSPATSTRNSPVPLYGTPPRPGAKMPATHKPQPSVSPGSKELSRILSSPDLKRTDSIDRLIVSENAHETVRHALLEKPKLQRWDSADYYSMPDHVRTALVSHAKNVFNQGLAPPAVTTARTEAARLKPRQSSGLSSVMSFDVRPYHSGPLFGSSHSLLSNLHSAGQPFYTGLPSPAGDTAGSGRSSPRSFLAGGHMAPHHHGLHKRWDSGDFYSLPEEQRAQAPTQSRRDLEEALRASDLAHSFQPRASSLSLASFKAPSAEEQRPPAPRLAHSHHRWDSGEFYGLKPEERTHARTQSREELEEFIQTSQERLVERRPRRSSLSMELVPPPSP